MNYLSELDAPLLQLSPEKKDIFTLGDAVKAVLGVGGIGSGKSSGSGQALAKAYLLAGFGGVVLCAKPDEADTWRKYAAETGREKSLIVFDGSGQNRFNFLDYEINRTDGGKDKTALALDVLMKIYEGVQSYDNKSKGANENPYWENSVRLLLMHSIDILYRAYGKLLINDILEFVRTMPESTKEFNKTFDSPAVFEKLAFHYRTLLEAKEQIKPLPEGHPDRVQFKRNIDYLGSYYDLEKKTKSIILSVLESMLMDFSRGDIETLFCTETTIKPEYCTEGAIIVLDFPLKVWQRGGYLAQYIFKYAFQRFVERRDIRQYPRPLFLWSDEAQLFVNSYDAEFLGTVRSAKCCTVFLTQSIPAIKSKLKSNEEADELLNNFQTRIIHTCFDKTSQEWAADSIGKALIGRWSENFNDSTGRNSNKGRNTNTAEQHGNQHHVHDGGFGGIGGGSQHGGNFAQGENYGEGINEGRAEGIAKNQVVDYELLPSFFASRLKMGGKENGYLVDGVVIRAGKIWDYTKKTYLVCSFEQRSKSTWIF